MECNIGQEIQQTCFSLSAWDYVIFASLLAVSAIIGGYFAYKSRNQSPDADDYLLGGRNMSPYPVALSLTASLMSAIAVLGLPAEFYLYGTMFWWFGLAYFFMCIIVSEIYIPIFYRLQVTSTYEYLEIRFNRAVRLLATTIYIINSLFYIGVVIFAPSLALSAVTGLGLWWSVVVTAGVCILYTSLGGLKAVIWTDVFQCLVMWIGLIAVIIKGSLLLGGFNQVWQIASDGGRVEFLNFDFDPKLRHTFWTISIGGTLYWTGGYGTSQTISQRYVCCKSEKQAKLALYLNLIGMWIMLLLVGLAGLVMFAFYAGCDPYDEGWVISTDQLMPYFVMDIFHDYPGVPGLFICSAFSGSLSTVSSGTNGMATVTVQDFILPYWKLSEKKILLLSKVLVIVYGVLCTIMAVITSQLGTVLEVAFAINGVVNGVMVGLFTLAMLLPWTNPKGAFVGTIAGLGITIWVYVGSQIYPPTSEMTQILPRCSDMCNGTSSETSCPGTDSAGLYTTVTSITTTPPAPSTTPELPGVANLYAVSYLYHNLIGFLTTVVVGLIASFMTGYQKPSELPPETVRPFFDHFVFKWLPEKARRTLRCGVRRDRRSSISNDRKKHENCSYEDDEKDDFETAKTYPGVTLPKDTQTLSTYL